MDIARIRVYRFISTLLNRWVRKTNAGTVHPLHDTLFTCSRDTFRLFTTRSWSHAQRWRSYNRRTRRIRNCSWVVCRTIRRTRVSETTSASSGTSTRQSSSRIDRPERAVATDLWVLPRLFLQRVVICIFVRCILNRLRKLFRYTQLEQRFQRLIKCRRNWKLSYTTPKYILIYDVNRACMYYKYTQPVSHLYIDRQ